MTIETWFISDTHFGHSNILKFEPVARPFKDLAHMHEALINNWNSVIRPKDKVYHLGDFAFGRNWIKIADRLNGRKILVMGNHDKYDSAEYLKHFEQLRGMIFWDKCVLSHMPVHRNFGGRCIMNIHGHLHSKFVSNDFGEPDPHYFNVSVEHHNCFPVNADEIIKQYSKVE
jgi:calcineurin-like phosphoesterase family protein